MLNQPNKSMYSSRRTWKNRAKICLFSKKERKLQDKIWFSSEKNLKWLTFLPFETPTLLFLPKIGAVLLYSFSFSMINSL